MSEDGHRYSFSAPKGGWLRFDRDGRVVPDTEDDAGGDDDQEEENSDRA